MKFLRYGPKGAERPAMLDANGGIRDLSAHCADIGGAMLTDLDRFRALDPLTLPLVAGQPRIGPCVAGAGKFMAIGLNYADHAAEGNLPIPPEPVLFMKATSSISGPDDPILLPRGSTRTDWEVELGIVIGKPAKYIDEDRAMDHVAGFCLVHDVSERAFQTERAGQWTKGKSCDSFGPIGPWLVTPDEIADPQDLGLWLDVNGERMQTGTTREMIFGLRHLVAYLSTFFTLHPGDIITTGTPAGVGFGMTPPRYLQAGDVVTLGIDGLGRQRQVVTAE